MAIDRLRRDSTLAAKAGDIARTRENVARLEEPDKYWKFSPADLAERERWDDYQLAFREALSATSRPWAPWYAVPADSKPFARLAVARIVRAALEGMDLRYPEVPEAQEARFTECRRILEAEA